jgi:hypothetical protein
MGALVCAIALSVLHIEAAGRRLGDRQGVLKTPTATERTMAIPREAEANSDTET